MQSQDLTVSLDVTRSSCRNHEHPDQVDVPVIGWENDTTAIVSVVTYETSSTVVAERSSRAHLAGAKLDLCYNVDQMPPGPNGLVDNCAWPVHLKFRVSGIARGTYESSVGVCR